MNLRSVHPMLQIAHPRCWAAIVLALTPGVSLTESAYPAEVSTLRFGHGTRLTDTHGLTLYQYENDLREPGKSTCTDDCAVMRPPLLVADPAQEIPENFSLIEREDGTRQWAYEGMPLYRYARDGHAGAAYGAGNGWAIAFEPITTPAEITIANTVLGYVLASSSGRTLYFHSGDPQSDSIDCTGECLQTWLALAAPWGAIDHGAFSVKVRGDGVYQWAYQNRPLYQYSGDSARGDANGEGAEGVWRAVILEPAPPAPDWTTVVGSDGGALYADSNGMTLYTLFEDENATEQSYLGGNHCDEACLAKYWNPVRPQSKVAPIGDWSVIENQDRTLQWAYMGRPVYTLKLETRPGQLYYTTYRQFQWMKPIMYSLPALQGVF